MEHNKINKSVLISCFLAGCLEMYDFAIFGFLSQLINDKYLSFLSGTNSLIITYSIFAVGFLFRPVGSLIFGYIGDVYGRKPALIISVSMMGIASLGMSLLPDFESIGILSCYLIAIIRIIQGISVGGEYNGAILYAMEHNSKNRIGLIGSLATIGTTLGLVIATFVSKFLQDPALPSYSWRFAFLLGFFLSILGYFIRKKLTETPEFNELRRKSGIPLFNSFKKMPSLFLIVILVAGANNSNLYYLLVYIPNRLSVDFNIGLMITTINFFLVPIFGWISDKVNRATMLSVSCAFLGIYNLFLYNALLEASSSTTQIILLAIASIMTACIISISNIFVIEVFPTEYRYSSASFGYSLGAALLGGTVLIVCSVIEKIFENSSTYVSLYLSILSILGSIAAVYYKKYKNIKYY